MRAIVGLVLALCASAAAHAADLNDPVWDSAPGREDWAKAYPMHAAQAGISGAVKMKCAATSTGSLADCSVIQETPTGEGFGAAALSLAGGMTLKPTGGDGHPVTGRNLVVPVRFEAAMLRDPHAIIGQPNWLRKPDAETLQQFFPAQARGVEGHTSMHCVISTRGLLDSCVVDEETPAGRGFAAAALGMSSVFLMRPMTVDGLPVGGASVRIGIRFMGGGSTEEVAHTVSVLRMAPWMSAPTSEQVSAAFPKSAVGKTSAAHVVMRCALRDDGGLVDCDPISETPRGQGFVHAAQSLTKDFRAYVDPKKDKLSNLRVDVPFDFRDPSLPALPMEVYDPLWLRHVSPEAFAKLYPAAALQAGVRSGKAEVICGVAHDGSLKECSVVSETPAGLGFGNAALTVASVMVMNPWTAQGTPVEGAKIRLPIRLELPADAPAAPATPKP
jgi:TonB family protein